MSIVPEGELDVPTLLARVGSCGTQLALHLEAVLSRSQSTYRAKINAMQSDIADKARRYRASIAETEDELAKERANALEMQREIRWSLDTPQLESDPNVHQRPYHPDPVFCGSQLQESHRSVEQLFATEQQARQTLEDELRAVSEDNPIPY